MPNSLLDPQGIVRDDEQLHDVVSSFDVEYKVDRADVQRPNLLHFHDCYEIVYYVQSCNSAYIQDVGYAINTHDILVIPPREIHAIRYTAGVTYARYVLYFSRAFIEPALHAMGLEKALTLFDHAPCKKVSLSPKHVGRFDALFDVLCQHHRKCQTDRGDDQSLVKAYTAVIVGELYRRFQQQAKEAPPRGDLTLVEQIVKHINDHYAEEISLEQLEVLLYTSRYNICRTFRREMGTPLVEYIQRKRILEAQRMLLETDESIAQVAFGCGFNNVQHFYRVFRKFAASTPCQYQKTKRQGAE